MTTTDPSNGKRLEPWQQFTILDAFLLQLAFALGLAWGWAFTWREELWLLGSGTAVAFGSVLAAPIVLSVQWFLRGRRALPSVGERLWIASFLCWLASYFLVILLWASVRWRSGEHVVWGIGSYARPVYLAQTICAGVALVWLTRPEWRKRHPPPCKWTDLFGCVACLLFWLWLWSPLLSELLGLSR